MLHKDSHNATIHEIITTNQEVISHNVNVEYKPHLINNVEVLGLWADGSGMGGGGGGGVVLTATFRSFPGGPHGACQIYDMALSPVTT